MNTHSKAKRTALSTLKTELFGDDLPHYPR